MSTVLELSRLADDGGRHHADDESVVLGPDITALDSPVAEWDDTERYHGREAAIRSLIRRGIQLEAAGLNRLSSRQLWQLVHDIHAVELSACAEEHVAHVSLNASHAADKAACPFAWDSFRPAGWGSARL